MLTINNKSDSIVVDQLPIYLNWRVNYQQKAYDLSVVKDDRVIFSLNQIGSKTNALIEGFQLEPNTDYQVKLITYSHDQKMEVHLNSFHTGNMGCFKGEWIYNGKSLINESDYYQENRNPVFRKIFNVSESIIESKIHIVGLGFYKLTVNGVAVGDSELNTDWTNYEKTVYYDTYRIGELLKLGQNEITVELGNGWFNPAPLTLFSKYNLRKTLSIGEPTLLADIIIKTASQTTVIPSDETWDVAEGPYLFNNIYLGEVLDYQLLNSNKTTSLKDPIWQASTTIKGPSGKLEPSIIPKIKQSKRLSPNEIIVVSENELIVDFGKVLTGFIDATFTVCGGQEVELTYSEELNVDYTLKTDSTLAGFIGKAMDDGFVIPGGLGAPGRAEQKDKIICRNGLIHYVNQFTYHSFRYVALKGINLEQINDINAVYVHTLLNSVGSFTCSDENLNHLYEIGGDTKLNNIHSVLSDCARERFAYGGDIVALAKSMVYQFDAANLYEKTIRDFINDVRLNGGFPETAPFMGIKTNGTGNEAGPLAWQFVVPYLLDVHYQHYGNLHLVKDIYPYLTQQLAHLDNLGLDEVSQHCLGDWGSQDKNSEDYKSSSPAIRFTTACFYYWHVLLLAKFAKTLHYSEDFNHYSAQAEALKNEIVKCYKNEDGSFSDKSQTSYVFAIYLNLVDDEYVAIQQLAALIEDNQHLIRCGIFGQSFAYEIFRKNGSNKVIYQWLMAENGIQGMLLDNSATLKEYFGDNQHGSCNHAMFSSYSSWFYQALGGISVAEGAIGSDQIVVAPYFCEEIDFVKCEHETPKGKVICQWTRTDSDIKLVIQVPFNLKKCTLLLDKRYHINLKGLERIHTSNNNVVFDLTDIGAVEINLCM
nr:family 78 glycoside hydrolase catalytic domain [uncultured Tolumonas sp.]